MAVGNSLTGPIPNQIGNLAGLNFLDSCKTVCCQFQDRPLVHSNNLPHHFLLMPIADDNQLSGTIPTQIGQLANLESLRLCKKICSLM